MLPLLALVHSADIQDISFWSDAMEKLTTMCIPAATIGARGASCIFSTHLNFVSWKLQGQSHSSPADTDVKSMEDAVVAKFPWEDIQMNFEIKHWLLWNGIFIMLFQLHMPLNEDLNNIYFFHHSFFIWDQK